MSGRAFQNIAVLMGGPSSEREVSLSTAKGCAAVLRGEGYEVTEIDAGDDLVERLRAVKPDAVFNCTWPDAHEPVSLTAFAHDCHVLGEKPLACSMVSAKRMITSRMYSC